MPLWATPRADRHHANPNKEDHDPDIGEGVLAFTTAQAVNRAGRLPRAIARNQAVVFFPLLTLEGLNLHAANAERLVHAYCAQHQIPTPRPACSPPTPARCATCTHSAKRYARRNSP